MLCPCCSSKLYSDCCQPFLFGDKTPEKPEELMRSRYTAYTQVNVKYLIQTTHPAMRKYYSEKSIRKWAENSRWLKLEVLSSSENTVHFKAYFEENGVLKIHEEFSSFSQDNGIWYYLDGK